MKIHRIHSGAGESLVEVTVSAVIFLMMMAVLQGSISFCTNAQHKSEEIRQENAEICRNLQSASYIPGAENMTYLFKATTADGETPGAEAAVLFRIAVELGTKEVTYLDADGTPKTTTFYLFGASDAKGTGEADDGTEDTGGDAP
ncbi:hypothetical protein AALD74_07520 [Lachnospiraceae bacterium 48-21]